MEFAAEEDKWNQWRFHMSAFEINGLHGNTGLFRSESDPPSLRFWLTCQMWTELGRRATIAVLWLALCSAALLGGNVSPPNVLITQSNPFPPQWGPLRLLSFFNLFQFGLYSFCPCSIHSDFISYNFSPFSTFPPPPLSGCLTTIGTGRASGCLLTQELRGTVIKLNGLNMSLSSICIKPIHKGSPAQFGDLNTNISDHLHLQHFKHTN